MGKKVYIGVNNVPKNVTKIYVGVNGVARKVIKGYVGVNGVARVFWDGGGGIVGGFWFFYETLQNKEFIEFIPDTYSIYTANTGIVFFAMIVAEYNSEEALVPLLVSTDRDAVTIRSSVGAEYTAAGSVTVNGDTWYWNAWQVFVWKRNYQYSPNCLLKNNVYSWQDSQVVTDLLDRIYTDDFAEDYQVGQTYNLPAGDIEKTVRKAIAIFLFKNAPLIANRNSYQLVLSNVETIVNHVLNDKNNYDKIHIVLTIPNDTDIWCTVYYSNDSVSNVTLSAYGSGVETAYKLFTFYNPTIQYYKYTQIKFLSSGSVTHQSASYTGVMTRTVGVAVTENIQAYHGGHQVWLTNLGLKWGKTIYSTLYPNANVYDAGTVSTNNGQRSPVSKANDGNAVVFCVKNCSDGSYGGNWMGTFSIALTAEAARLTSVGSGTGDNTTSHVIDGVTYWISSQITNAQWGGGTTIYSDCPIFQDWFIVGVNSSVTTAKVEEILQRLGITT